MVKPFTSYPGIKSVVSGYSGGHVDNPTYEQVCTNQTGHVEAVQITFDPEVTSFENILTYISKHLTTDDQRAIFDEAKAINQSFSIMMSIRKAAEFKSNN